MKVICPKCRAPFLLPSGWSEEITCPGCGTKFWPVDEDQLQADQRARIVQRISGYFQSVRHPLAKRVSETLAAETPVPSIGGYVGREDEIENLLQEALRTGNAELLDAMLKAFAEAQDWYFCHKLMETTTVSQATEAQVANSTMKAPHLGGQSGDYFHLLAILTKKREDVREWCEAIIKKEQRKNHPNSILAENMELVLDGSA